MRICPDAVALQLRHWGVARLDRPTAVNIWRAHSASARVSGVSLNNDAIREPCDCTPRGKGMARTDNLLENGKSRLGWARDGGNPTNIPGVAK